MQSTSTSSSTCTCTTRTCIKVPARFSEECFIWADGLCIGCMIQWATIGRKNSNMRGFFLHDPVCYSLTGLSRDAKRSWKRIVSLCEQYDRSSLKQQTMAHLNQKWKSCNGPFQPASLLYKHRTMMVPPSAQEMHAFHDILVAVSAMLNSSLNANLNFEMDYCIFWLHLVVMRIT